MASISFLSAAINLLQLSVLILSLSPTTNCLSLDDQLQQLNQEIVRNSMFHPWLYY